jgi:hypothetical protein
MAAPASLTVTDPAWLAAYRQVRFVHGHGESPIKHDHVGALLAHPDADSSVGTTTGGGAAPWTSEYHREYPVRVVGGHVRPGPAPVATSVIAASAVEPDATSSVTRSTYAGHQPVPTQERLAAQQEQTRRMRESSIPALSARIRELDGPVASQQHTDTLYGATFTVPPAEWSASQRAATITQLRERERRHRGTHFELGRDAPHFESTAHAAYTASSAAPSHTDLSVPPPAVAVAQSLVYESAPGSALVPDYVTSHRNAFPASSGQAASSASARDTAAYAANKEFTRAAHFSLGADADSTAQSQSSYRSMFASPAASAVPSARPHAILPRAASSVIVTDIDVATGLPLASFESVSKASFRLPSINTESRVKANQIKSHMTQDSSHVISGAAGAAANANERELSVTRSAYSGHWGSFRPAMVVPVSERSPLPQYEEFSSTASSTEARRAYVALAPGRTTATRTALTDLWRSNNRLGMHGPAAGQSETAAAYAAPSGEVIHSRAVVSATRRNESTGVFPDRRTEQIDRFGADYASSSYRDVYTGASGERSARARARTDTNRESIMHVTPGSETLTTVTEYRKAFEGPK